MNISELANNLWYGLLMGLKQIGDAMQDAWSFIWGGIVTTFEKTVLELQKAWIRTKGLFDSDEEVNAQIAVVEKEYSDRKSAREQKSADAVNRRESERKALGDEWDSSNKSIDDAMKGRCARTIQEINDDCALDYASFSAAISGNPKLKRKVVIETRLKELDALERQHRRNIRVRQDQEKSLASVIPAMREELPELEKFVKMFPSLELGSLVMRYGTTLQEKHVHFRAWFEDILLKLGSTPSTQIDSLLPHLWNGVD